MPDMVEGLKQVFVLVIIISIAIGYVISKIF